VNSLRNRIIKFLGYIVTIAAFAFLIKSIISMHPDFSKIGHPYYAIILSLLFSAGFGVTVYISAYAWKSILEFIYGDRIGYRTLAPIYAKANIGKYLPGNVMHFAGRNIMAGKIGFTQLDIAFSSIVEVAVLIVAACIWSALLAFRSFTRILKDMLKAHWMVASVICAVLIVCVCLFAFKLIKGGYFKKYRKFFTRGFLLLLCRLFLIYSITLIVPGVFLGLILAAVFGCSLTLQLWLLIIAAYTVSWVMGFIVPGAPGGIGVRESVLLLILGNYFKSDIVLMAVILHRIISIIGDVIAFALVPLLKKQSSE
jgi:uncharacterized membrane protein YbhN (UPF0104 family)